MRINMFPVMRTTLDIEDGVFRRAKLYAVERGRPLGEIVSDALRESLKAHDKEVPKTFVMPVFGTREKTVTRDARELARLRDEGR